jgi:hypothetical protein
MTNRQTIELLDIAEAALLRLATVLMALAVPGALAFAWWMA